MSAAERQRADGEPPDDEHGQAAAQPPAGEQQDAPAGLSYEAASARVEEIIRRLDSGQASLNETLQLLGEGKTLIEHCARELSAVGDALEELRLDELVSRLEGAGGA